MMIFRAFCPPFTPYLCHNISASLHSVFPLSLLWPKWPIKYYDSWVCRLPCWSDESKSYGTRKRWRNQTGSLVAQLYNIYAQSSIYINIYVRPICKILFINIYNFCRNSCLNICPTTELLASIYRLLQGPCSCMLINYIKIL